MRRYTNLDGTVPDQGPGAIFRWQVLDRLRAPRKPVEPSFSAPRQDNDGSALSARTPHLTWIGHATFVQRLGGQLLATDPIWSDRIFTTKRLSAPGVAFADLPKLDVVTISHAHFDHLDVPTLRRIGADTLYVVPVGNAALLRAEGLRDVVELEWWQSHRVGDLTITLVPAQHWSMRSPFDKNKRLWGGFVYESPEGVSYHAGDTAFAEDVFTAIAERMPRIDWAMLPIGAYQPRWFMRRQHMGPEEAGRAWQILGARTFVAMHWATFRLTDEPLAEPPELLRAFWQEQRLEPSRLWIPAIGETRALIR